jgi:hypothetical protein
MEANKMSEIEFRNSAGLGAAAVLAAAIVPALAQTPPPTTTPSTTAPPASTPSASTPPATATTPAPTPAAEAPPPGYWIDGIHLSGQFEAGFNLNPMRPSTGLNFGQLITDHAN